MRTKLAQPAPAASASATPIGSSSVPMLGVSNTSPATASAIHANSISRRDVMTATVNGPTNSIATAMPSGIRAIAP